MTMPIHRPARVLVAAAVAAAISGTALAQAQLEEVTVTARKRTESLQEVPITVTAFSEETIVAQGIRNVQDVAKFTPGLSWDKGFAPQDTRPNIRGLPTTRGRPPIGILLDGIDISSESIATAGGSMLMNLKLVDVERIEVVKGPQSALYGRVAFGGAINYVSKRPNLDEVEGNLLADVATDSLYEVRGAFNVPLLGGKAALRINGLYSDFDGFFRNEISGENVGGWNTRGIAAALRFAPTEGIDFTLRMSYSDDEAEPRASYYVGQAVPGRNQPLASPANAVGVRVGAPPGATTGGSVVPATIPYPLLGEVRNYDRVLLSVDPLTGRDYAGGDLESFITSLVGEIDLGFATLTSYTGYTRANALSVSDADFFAAPATAVTRPTPGTAEPLPALSITDVYSEARQFSQEFRLGTLDTDDRLRWAVGALYWREDYDAINSSIFISGFVRNPPLAPAGWSAARELQLRGRIPGDLNFRNTRHKSGYGMLDFRFNDQWSASAEWRYSEEDFDYLFGRPIALNIVPATGALVPWPGYTGATFRPSASSSFNAPRFTVNYKANEDLLFYGSVSKGVKPAGFLNVGVVLDANDARYEPETLWNYEVGAKTSWLDDRLRLNAAYFHMVYEDRITQLLVPDPGNPLNPQGTRNVVRNIGEAKVDGVELELTAVLTEGLTLSAAYTYLDPRFTDSEVPNTAPLNIAGSGNCRVGTVGPTQVCFTNTNGRQLEQSARHALVATLDYRRPLANDWTLNSQLAAQYRSKRFTSPDNLTWMPAWTNVDAQVGFENESFGVTLYVTNLLDFDKPVSAQTYGDPFIASPVAPPVLAYTTFPADPRQFGVRATFRF
ncbi:MAG: TonB-dependent receptor [Steroidobacteraceae bacterium]|jgi:outer membrane receptor protein involved in Fe transport|nr:TonB-dependent receptor [Steroidobacteraceae bacterium]